MAYTKIMPIKVGTHLKNACDYIQNSKKTNGVYVFTYNCGEQSVATDFESIQKNAMKKGNNIAHHICQSFSPEDNVSPEQALEIGKELMEKMYPNHQYVLAVHTDKEHTHNHIIINSVDFTNYKKIHSNRESLWKIRKISDEICAEKKLSVIKPSISRKQKLKKDIDEAVKKSSNFDDFLAYMSEHYEVKQGKYLAFKAEGSEKFIRSYALGTAYREFSIKKRIENNLDNLERSEIKNKKTQVYDDKIIYASNRKKLIRSIEVAVKKSQTFADFLKILSENYEIKKGKHLALRPKTAARFIRLDSLGEIYSEQMLRLRIEDKDEYNLILAEHNRDKINKITTNASKFAVTNNINNKIKTLNFLKENNISLERLEEKIRQLQDAKLKELAELSKINEKISNKFDVINARKAYWQYKPYAEQARKINDAGQRVRYAMEHKTELDKLKKAIDTMNKAKEDYGGELPQNSDLYGEVEKLNFEKDMLLAKNKKTKSELANLTNIKYNIESILYKNKEVRKHEKEKTKKHIEIGR